MAQILGSAANVTLVAKGFSSDSGYGTFRPGVQVWIGSL
jgi:hypothetical protein